MFYQSKNESKKVATLSMFFNQSPPSVSTPIALTNNNQPIEEETKIIEERKHSQHNILLPMDSPADESNNEVVSPEEVLLIPLQSNNMKFDKNHLFSQKRHSDQRLGDFVNDLSSKKRTSSRSVAPVIIDSNQNASGNMKNNSGSMRRGMKTPKSNSCS